MPKRELCSGPIVQLASVRFALTKKVGFRVSTRSQQESTLLGVIVGAILGIGIVMAAALLVDFGATEESIVTGSASTTTTVAAAPGSKGAGAGQGPGLGRSGGGQGQGNGRGGGPPEGRGPESHLEDDLGDPLNYGTASPEVLDAFAVGGCVACHTIKGVGGGAANLGPGLSRLGEVGGRRVAGLSAAAYIEQSVLDPTAFVRPDCPTGPCLEIMPTTYGETLTADQIATIVGYLAVLGTAAEADVLTAPSG
jgi:hypothetical protein